jgi:hypothetical protein
MSGRKNSPLGTSHPTRPRTLTERQREELVSLARDRTRIDVAVNEIRAFRAWRSYPAIATILFNPVDVDEHTFTVTEVLCERKRTGWRCEPGVLLTFVYAGDYADSFRVHSSVPSTEAALGIYQTANRECRITYQSSFVFKPSLTFDDDDGLYRLHDTAYCTYTFTHSNGNAVRRDRFAYLE